LLSWFRNWSVPQSALEGSHLASTANTSSHLVNLMHQMQEKLKAEAAQHRAVNKPPIPSIKPGDKVVCSLDVMRQIAKEMLLSPTLDGIEFIMSLEAPPGTCMVISGGRDEGSWGSQWDYRPLPIITPTPTFGEDPSGYMPWLPPGNQVLTPPKPAPAQQNPAPEQTEGP
jgi:hypothetical protein